MGELQDDAGMDDAFDDLYRTFVDRGGADRVLRVLQDWDFSRLGLSGNGDVPAFENGEQ